eukprot:6195590-Pleurochrysis_carterae.AAC.5
MEREGRRAQHWNAVDPSIQRRSASASYLVRRPPRAGTALGRQRPKRLISAGLRGLRGGQLCTRFVVAPIVLRCRFVTFRATLGAVFVPVGTLAPPARGPLVTPPFICLWAGAFGIGGLTACFFGAVVLAAYREGVCRTRVGLEFAAHVAYFCVTQHAASGCNSEVEVADARVKREFHIEKCRQAVTQAADGIGNLFR